MITRVFFFLEKLPLSFICDTKMLHITYVNITQLNYIVLYIALYAQEKPKGTTHTSDTQT